MKSVDTEYETRMANELRMGSRRKGPDWRVRYREAGRKKAEAENRAATGRRALKSMRGFKNCTTKIERTAQEKC